MPEDIFRSHINDESALLSLLGDDLLAMPHNKEDSQTQLSYEANILRCCVRRLCYIVSTASPLSL